MQQDKHFEDWMVFLGTKRKKIVDKVFRHLDDLGASGPICNMELVGCRFDACQLINHDSPPKRTVIRNVHLIDCTAEACNVNAALLDTVTVYGLKHQGRPLQLLGVAFRHVVLKGEFDRIFIWPECRSGDLEKAWLETNAKFYTGARVDWAIDISGGEFRECDIRGIPVSLIRRDAATQVILSRAKLDSPKWTRLEFHDGLPMIVRTSMMTFGLDDTIIVAPKRSARFETYLANFEILRKAGLAY